MSVVRAEHADHQPPGDCPVCGDTLLLTQLGCDNCGTRLSGRFKACSFCSLSAQDQKMLRVFLTSRGNMRELARELGVSYPTARQRYAELLHKLGLEAEEGAIGTEPPQPVADRDNVLRRLAAGELDLDEATELLVASDAGHDGEVP